MRQLILPAVAILGLITFSSQVAAQTTDQTLQRLTARLEQIEKENAALRERVRRLENTNTAAVMPGAQSTPPNSKKKLVAYAGDAAVRPAYKAPPVPPPAPIGSWSGLYLGGHLGAGLSRDQWSGNPVDLLVALDGEGPAAVGSGLAPLGSHNDVGLLGGITAGYNYQFINTPWVVGIEGEWMFADLEGNHDKSQDFSGSVDFDICCLVVGSLDEHLSTKVEDIATIAARFGITSGPQDRTLWYVKGGGAWVRDSFAETMHAVATFSTFAPACCTAGSFDGSGSVRQDHWGWMVGTGIEWGLIDNLSAKIEYEFLDFGNTTFTMPISGTFIGAAGPVTQQTFNRNFNINQQIHVVKVGLNYRFNWWNY